MNGWIIALAGLVGGFCGAALGPRLADQCLRSVGGVDSSPDRHGSSDIVPVDPPSGSSQRGGLLHWGDRERSAIMGTVLATVAALLAWRISEPLLLLTFAATAALGVTLAVIDVATHRLPDRLTLPAFAVALVGLTTEAVLHDQPGRLLTAIFCALATAAFYLALALVPRGYGLGDVKLGLTAGLISGWYGPDGALIATLVALLLAGLAAVVLALPTRLRRSHLPYGPFILLGTYTVILVAA